MAFKITYKKTDQRDRLRERQVPQLYGAIAAAEGLDLSSFHAMEAQLAQVCRRDKKSVKDYQENYFKELVFFQHRH